MTNDQLAKSGSLHVRKIQRCARRGIGKLNCTQTAKLNNDAKVQLYASQSILGAIHHASSTNRRKLVENKVSTDFTKLSIQQTAMAILGTPCHQP